MPSSAERGAVPTASFASPSAVVAVARDLFETTREGEISFLAAAISYFTLVSLVPLLVLAAVVAVSVGGDALRAQLLVYVESNLPAAEQYVEAALADETGQGGIGVVSLLVSLWGALKVFRGFDTAFSRIYGSDVGGLVDQIRDAVTVLVSLGAGMFGVVALVTVVAILDFSLFGLVSPLLLLVALTVGFLPLYYVLPDADVSVREALPGAVFAAVGYTLLAAAFGIYAALAGGMAGALGAVLLLVTYFYFAGTVLLVGAVLNVVLARGNRQGQEPPPRGVE